MFEARITQAKLSEGIDVANALVDEVILEFTQEGLSLIVVDPANVGMATSDMPSEDFLQYETDGERLGVPLEKLLPILEMMEPDDELSMVLNEETRKLKLSSNGLEYTMSLLDPDSINTMESLPDISFEARATIETPTFNRVVKAADMITDHFTLRVVDGEFTIEASGDTDNIDYDANEADVAPGASGMIEDAKSKFSLSYMKDMSEAINGDYIAVSIAEDMPVRIEFKLEQSNGTGVFFVAPRISSD